MTEIIRTNIGLATYLMPTGSLSDNESLASLQKAFAECFDADAKEVVLNLERVSNVNGAVLEFLLDMQDTLVARGGKLSLMQPNGLLKDIFKITDVDKYIEVKTGL
ncbi:MAG: STAS domain-containing protein [Desulfobulbales bacterium]|nr:STAS domain-containing protein [Desulfobulbales bacterium]